MYAENDTSITVENCNFFSLFLGLHGYFLSYIDRVYNVTAQTRQKKKGYCKQIAKEVL